MTPVNWAMLLLTAALFGSSFSFLNVAVAQISPVQLAAARVFLAAVILWAFLHLSGRRLPRDRGSWVALSVMGFLLAVIPYLGIALGQARISASLGGILFATLPAFTALLAPILTDEKPINGLQSLGLLASFGGVVLAIGPDALVNAGAQLAGASITLCAAFSYAIGNLYAKRQSGLDPVVMACGQLLVGAAVLVPLAVVFGDGFPTELSGSVVLATLAVGSLATAAPVLLMFVLIKRVGATRTSILTYFIPISSVLIGVVFLREALSPLTVLGFGLIIGGAIWFTRHSIHHAKTTTN